MSEFNQCAACGHVQQHHQPNCAVENCSCPEYLAYGPGEQTCPRRMNQFGPWKREEMLDHWSTSHWGPYYSARWPEEFERPRVCLFCGGIKPEDAIKLLLAGWESESTGKNYKRYLHPPGYHARMEALTESVRLRLPIVDSGYVEPTPPVKVYVEHFSREDIERFNAALNQRAA